MISYVREAARAVGVDRVWDQMVANLHALIAPRGSGCSVTISLSELNDLPRQPIETTMFLNPCVDNASRVPEASLETVNRI